MARMVILVIIYKYSNIHTHITSINLISVIFLFVNISIAQEGVTLFQWAVALSNDSFRMSKFY